ncbi:MAG: hypothetical protein DRP35_07555 [Candidatus Zixiibacteriota bacterium]|nr:MAG: hypothetical protein DRP35_07555 [candidate division Zixibacteria bacterium]
MLLTVSKKFEFSASHRYFYTEKSKEENFALFGVESLGGYGHGHNYVINFIFAGEVDKKTGMLINITDIKNRILPMLAEKFDHKYLNVDNSDFIIDLPTPENVGRSLLNNADELFCDLSASLYACSIDESNQTSAYVKTSGEVERILKFDFSSARRTYSPFISEEENLRLFGEASSITGHGHHYRVLVHLASDNLTHGMVIPDIISEPVMKMLFDELDHKNFNEEVAWFKNKPVTTEILTRIVFEKLSEKLPVSKIRINENDNFFIEYDNQHHFKIGVNQSFFAAHRLHSDNFSDSENVRIYDKCNNLAGHGHQYILETIIEDKLDEKSGTVANLAELNIKVNSILSEWNYKHLDLETNDFKSIISTGENIITVLWEKLNNVFSSKLYSLKLWETPNNVFKLERK